jgi:PleD family two-component response regulator
VLVEQLESRGYRVIEAADGEQALAACRRDRPDVVLLDVEMPQLDGHAVLARVKADPLLADIPVVFVTSRVTTEDVVEGLRLGAHDYLRKPFEPSELLARVHAVLVVLAGTGAGEAAALGERIRRAIAETPVPLEEAPLEVTASVGVTSDGRDGWEGLVRRADTGLYAAKESGRNRVVTGPPAGAGWDRPG